jgi:hypothetical protein
MEDLGGLMPLTSFMGGCGAEELPPLLLLLLLLLAITLLAPPLLLLRKDELRLNVALWLGDPPAVDD